MVSAIFGVIGDAVTEFAQVLGEAATAIANIFYVPGASGAAGEITFLGVLALVGVGSGIVYWLFNLIQGLIKNTGKKK